MSGSSHPLLIQIRSKEVASLWFPHKSRPSRLLGYASSRVRLSDADIEAPTPETDVAPRNADYLKALAHRTYLDCGVVLAKLIGNQCIRAYHELLVKV